MVGVGFIGGGPFTCCGPFPSGVCPFALSGGLCCPVAAASFGVIDVPSDALAGDLSGGGLGTTVYNTMIRQSADGVLTDEAVGTPFVSFKQRWR